MKPQQNKSKYQGIRDLEVTGVSRNGRIRKKSSKLVDFEIDLKSTRILFPKCKHLSQSSYSPAKLKNVYSQDKNITQELENIEIDVPQSGLNLENTFDYKSTAQQRQTLFSHKPMLAAKSKHLRVCMATEPVDIYIKDEITKQESEYEECNLQSGSNCKTEFDYQPTSQEIKSLISHEPMVSPKCKHSYPPAESENVYIKDENIKQEIEYEEHDLPKSIINFKNEFDSKSTTQERQNSVLHEPMSQESKYSYSPVRSEEIYNTDENLIQELVDDDVYGSESGFDFTKEIENRSSIDALDSSDVLENDQESEGFRSSNDHADNNQSNQNLHLMEKSNCERFRDDQIIGKTRRQRKDKGNPRYTSYIMWAREIRSNLLKVNPKMDFSTLSKKLGELWATVPSNEKFNWRRRAKRANSTLFTSKANAFNSSGIRESTELSIYNRSEAISISRSGRYRKRSSKLVDFESLDNVNLDCYKRNFQKRKSFTSYAPMSSP